MKTTSFFIVLLAIALTGILHSPFIMSQMQTLEDMPNSVQIVQIVRQPDLTISSWFTQHTYDKDLQSVDFGFHFPEHLFDNKKRGRAAGLLAKANMQGTALFQMKDDGMGSGPLRYYSFQLPSDDAVIVVPNSINFDWDETKTDDVDVDWSEVDVIDLSGSVLSGEICFTRFTRLRVLALPKSGFPWPDSIELPPNLEELIIYNTRLGEHAWQEINSMQNIQRLVFVGCTIEEEGISTHMFGPRNRVPYLYRNRLRSSLRMLEIYYCQGDFLNDFQRQHWPKLEVIKTDMAHRAFSGNAVNKPDIGAAIFMSAPKLSHVELYKSQDFEDAFITDLEDKFVQGLLHSTNQVKVTLTLGW